MVLLHSNPILCGCNHESIDGHNGGTFKGKRVYGGHKASEELLADIEQLAQIKMSLQEKVTILSRCNPKLLKTC